LGVLEVIHDSLGISLSITNDCLELVNGTSEFSLDLIHDWASGVTESLKYGFETGVEVLEWAFDLSSESLEFSLGLLHLWSGVFLDFAKCCLCLSLDLFLAWHFWGTFWQFWRTFWQILLEESSSVVNLLSCGFTNSLSCVRGFIGNIFWGRVEDLLGGFLWVA